MIKIKQYYRLFHKHHKTKKSAQGATLTLTPKSNITEHTLVSQTVKMNRKALITKQTLLTAQQYTCGGSMLIN